MKRYLKYIESESFRKWIEEDQFNGALPEDESILGKVSEYIKTHDNGAEAIEILDMKYSEKKFAEELKKLIGSETPIYF